MLRVQSSLALLCVLLLLVPAAGAQTSVANEPATFWERLTHNYRQREVGPINMSNSGRLESLIRAGNLYLSLPDAIALALENNLDVELQRLGARISDASLLRAQAGGILRGATPQVQGGPGSAQGQRGQATGISTNASAQVSAAQSAGNTGTLIQQTGTSIPNLDPVVSAFVRGQHSTNPQTNSFVTGNNTLVNRTDLTNFQYSQSFLTGTSVSLALSSSKLTSNSQRADLNPSTSPSLSLNITQKLLQGFGAGVNSRNIVIAKNNREVNDLQFKTQVITTVSNLISLYWDLVAFNEDVKVKRAAVALNTKLLEDNKKQVEIGTLAPIEIVRAESEVAQAEQELTISETRVFQQETIMKNVLSRNGIASPTIADVHIIPTDRMTMPSEEAIEPIQDLVSEALRARPEIGQTRIQVKNDQIALKGSRSQLLPQVDAIFAFANNGLAGQVNDLPLPAGSPARVVPDYFLGGFSNALGQVFRRNFPDYSAAVQISIPLRNRSAQADMTIDQLTLRQREIGLQRQENQIRVDVRNALIAVQQTRAVYQAATKTRVFREQTLDAEQKKFALGASTIFNVIQVQRDLVQAQSTDVSALADYSKARVQLDTAVGRVLERNNISVEEAFRGQISRGPNPLPPAPK